MNPIRILTTKTVLLDTDALSAAALRARVERVLAEEGFANFSFAYEYENEAGQARYELTGDEELMQRLLNLFSEPVTAAERRCALWEERKRSGVLRRGVLTTAAAASFALAVLLLGESK